MPTHDPTPDRRRRARLGFAFLAPVLLAFAACDGTTGPDTDLRAQIYFVGVVSGEGPGALHDVFRMNPDGTGVENITSAPEGRVQNLRLSPDGRHLALVRDPGGVRNVFVIELASGEMAQLTDAHRGETISRANGRAPYWSPDGTRISFRSDREVLGQWDIYVMNADGTDQHRVSTAADTESTYMNHSTEWSPDGRVGFWHLYDADPADPYVPAERSYTVFPDGTGLRLFGEGTRQRPAWSPDGTQVAFYRYLESGVGLGVMRVDGTDERVLYEVGAASDTFFTFPYGRRPWSPDGSTLVFELYGGGERQIHLIGADGTGHRQLTDPAMGGRSTFASWSPDGSRVLFRNDGTGISDLYVIGVDGTGLTNLTARLSDVVEAVWAPGG